MEGTADEKHKIRQQTRQAEISWDHKRELYYKIQYQTKRKYIYFIAEKPLKKLNCNNNLISESRNIKYHTASINENLIRYQRRETRYRSRQKGNIYISTNQQPSRYRPEIRNIKNYTATNKKLKISNSIDNKLIITSRKNETFNMIQH